MFNLLALLTEFWTLYWRIDILTRVSLAKQKGTLEPFLEVNLWTYLAARYTCVWTNWIVKHLNISCSEYFRCILLVSFLLRVPFFISSINFMKKQDKRLPKPALLLSIFYRCYRLQCSNWLGKVAFGYSEIFPIEKLHSLSNAVKFIWLKLFLLILSFPLHFFDVVDG